MSIIAQVAPKSVLDYGCGKGTLALALHAKLPGLPIMLYDPGILPLSNLPQPADLLICTDVLEHIEPECLDNVMTHIATLIQKAGFFIVFTGDCGYKLPDGRPAHLIQKPKSWWEGKFLEHFPDFDVVFADTDLPMRFEVIVVKSASRSSVMLTEANINNPIGDPVPDLTAIEAIEKTQSPKPKGLLRNFGGVLNYKDE